MVWSLPEVLWIVYTFTVVDVVLARFVVIAVSGIVALSIDVNGRWWLLVVFLVSLFWIGAMLCNTVHAIVSGMVFLVLLHGGRGASTMPLKPLLKILWHALTTNLGSICYGSLFTAAIRTLRWEVGLAVVVVESAVTSIYICFAEDPTLIERWDAQFFVQLSEALHQWLQYQSARARQAFNNRLRDLTTI